MIHHKENDGGEALYDCQKHRIQIPAAGAQCKDPELYCKFRPSCLIHFLEREQARAQKNEASGGKGPTADA
jgi:hypothetical protein